MLARRDMGKIVFLDLVDRSGRIQLLVREQVDLEEVELNLGDIVGVSGHPAKSRRGEPSLQVSELELLAKIRVPLPDTFHGLTDVEQRYRRRYLDLLMNEETRRSFEIRTRAVTEIRRYLDEEGFLEVETPVLQPRYGGGFATPFVTHYNELGQDMYLRIATELYLKRLIVGGLERVYEIGKDFRNEGFSYKNSPEFTMLEWYEAYADYEDAMVRMETLVERVATGRARDDETLVPRSRGRREGAVAPAPARGRARRARALAPGRRTSFGLRSTSAGWTPRTTTPGPSSPITRSRSFVEPSLIEPTILYDYPVELSPFARTTDDDPTLVERFEYFVAGFELGNAYSEINDAEEQASRFREQLEEKEAGAAEFVEDDPDYVEALSYGMPPTAGLGLGIDRLAMVLTGSETIRDVILFPALKPRS